MALRRVTARRAWRSAAYAGGGEVELWSRRGGCNQDRRDRARLARTQGKAGSDATCQRWAQQGEQSRGESMASRVEDEFETSKVQRTWRRWRLKARMRWLASRAGADMTEWALGDRGGLV
ncbi:hypothetical protein ZWY2020_041144 [Hordeum vulgare]|nr:hypothetical protein ZWY2020_041144 [Hordeum vulgare]